MEKVLLVHNSTSLFTLTHRNGDGHQPKICDCVEGHDERNLQEGICRLAGICSDETISFKGHMWVIEEMCLLPGLGLICQFLLNGLH